MFRRSTTGRRTTIVNPGSFRTELLTEQSTTYAEPSIGDYDERRGLLVEYWKAQNGALNEPDGEVPSFRVHRTLTVRKSSISLRTPFTVASTIRSPFARVARVASP